MISALNITKLRLDMGDCVLSLQGLYARARGRTILDGVDLDVERGTVVALVGAAGAGKSAVIAAIAGTLRCQRGRIRYFGYELRGRSEQRIVRMGIVRTRAGAGAFGDMTALDDVTVGALLRRPRVGRARAYAGEMLALAGLENRAGIGAAALDPGAQRRLAIARALATEPELLLLDEPAAGLDAPAVAALRALLAAVRARGTTIVVATRAIDDCTSLADSVVEIDRGKTAEIGAHAAIDLRL